jgi:hypothetical protein
MHSENRREKRHAGSSRPNASSREGSLGSLTTRRPPFLLCNRNPLSRTCRHLAATALCAASLSALGTTSSRSGTARSTRCGRLSGFLLLRPPGLLSVGNALPGLRRHLALPSAALGGRRCGNAMRRAASQPLNLRLHSSRESSQPRPKLRGPLLEALEFDLHAEAGEVGRVAVRCCYSSSLRHAAMVAPSISAVGCRLRFRRQLSARTGAVEGSCRFAYPSRHSERVSSGLDLAFTDNRVFSTALERLRLRNINAQFSNFVMAAPDINIADFDAVSRVLRASTRRARIY